MRFPVSKTIIDISSGAVIVGAVGTVRLAGTSTAATIYSASSGGSAISGSQVTSDSRGVISFWIDDADYQPDDLFDIYVTATNYNPFTIENVYVSAFDSTVEHNNDGTHKYNDYEVDVRKYLPTGYVTDGSIDYSTEFQEAINAIRDFSLGSGGILRIPLGHWSLGTTGITLYEGIQLVGCGMSSLVSSAKAGGTWLVYTGTGNAITIDGEWTGFTSRRNITVENLNIWVQSGVNAGIYCDFLTLYKFDRVYIYGAADYGFYMVNSYNGTISGCKVAGAGKGLYSTIKADPDDVFSGQMLCMDTDFHNCTDKAVHITTSVNVMAQNVFLKCHFKSSAYGVYLDGTIQQVDFYGCHFEGNTTTDLYVGPDVDKGPLVDGCHFNNTNTVWKIDCDGARAKITNNTFTGGSTGWGLNLNGARASVRDNYLYGLANNKQIVIDTDATQTSIGKNSHSNATGHVVDNSTAASTIYEGEIILESVEFDLSGAAVLDHKFVTPADYWVQSIKILYIEATSADAGVALQFGDSANATRYMNHTSDANQAAYALVTPTISSAYIASGRRLIVQCAGGKTGTGTAKVIVRLVPFATA